MTLTLGINGFGRIGRTVLRVLAQDSASDIRVVAVNDPASSETLAHLLEFDSLHGRFPGGVDLTGTTLTAGGHKMRISQHRTPAQIDWSGVDLVLECSGRFTDAAQAAKHLKVGARRVLISAPASGDAKTIVFGVNDDTLSASDRIVSNASCTTNCLVPVAQVLHEAFGIEAGMMTTVHSYTSTQHTHDAPHEDLYRARAAALSMIPTSTGAAKTLGDVLPSLAGRITGQAIRVPSPNVSCIDLVATVSRKVSVVTVNAVLREAAAGRLGGILGTTDRKLVSTDFRQSPFSAVAATDQTRVQGEHLLRVLAWYDNEWGFASRMVDTARKIAIQASNQKVTPHY